MVASTLNKVARPKPIKSGPADAVIRETPYDVILEEIARKSLEKEQNKNKTSFYGLVVKIASDSYVKDRRVLSDLFLNEEYNIDREDNTSNSENSKFKIALLHIPSLYSYFTTHNIAESKFTSQILTSDSFLIPVKTGLSIKRGDIVKVNFGDIENFSDITLVQTGKTAPIIKGVQGGNVSLAETYSQEAQTCRNLQITPASGSSISARSLANPNNPTVGYGQFYSDMISNVLSPDKLRKRLIASLGSTKTRQELTNLPQPASGEVSSNQLETLFLNESAYIPFKVKIEAGSDKVLNYIKTLTPVQNNTNYSEFPVTLATQETKASLTTDDIKDNRSLYFTFEFISSANQQPGSSFKSSEQFKTLINKTLKDYIKGVVQNTYKYGFVESTNLSLVQVDIFGKSEDLADKNVDAAIEYSLQKKARNRPGVFDVVQNATYVSQTAALIGQPTDPAIIAQAQQQLDSCTRLQRVVNSQLYIPLAQDGIQPEQLEDFTADQILIQEILEDLQNIDDTSGKEFLRRAIFKDLPKSNSQLPSQAGNFSYNLQNEIIAVTEESSNEKNNNKGVQGWTVALPTTTTRGTNLEIMKKNGENLLKFAIAFRKFIADNEGLPEKNILLLPISVFRRYENVTPGRGVDVNSRHFYNRAMDFVVYANTDLNYPGYQKTDGLLLGSREEFETNNVSSYKLPAEIIYLYLIEFIKQNENPFGKSGVGLLRQSRNRKTSYIHYEYMIDYKEPKKLLGYKKPKTKKTRRWVSQPKNNDNSSVYKAAFGKENKDDIILEFMQKKITKAFRQVPDKIKRLLSW